ncbi:MAG TPA: hypothetical protein PLC80_07675 [Draconibacterium sp.]|nr:hypothetical protein [Draconibacterium sp.]
MKKNNNFSKSISFSLVFISLIIVFPKPGNSQEQNSELYALVEFMKVKPAEVNKYLDLEKTFWKPIQEERVKQKEIKGWRIFAVRFAGTGDEYNFVTATFFDDLSTLKKVCDVDIVKISPGKDNDKAYQEALKSREVVKRNLLIMNSSTESNVSYKYLQINFMKVKQGEESEYLNVENTVWKPVHEELTKAGSKAGWSVWKVVYPGGFGTDYQFLAVDDLSEYSQINMADIESIFSKVHSGKSVDALINRTNNSRILVRSELWELLETTQWQ